MTRRRAAVVLAVSLGLAIIGSTFIDLNKQLEEGMAPEPFGLNEAEHRLESATPRDICIAGRVSSPREKHKTVRGSKVPGRVGSSEVGVVSDHFVVQWNLDGIDLWLAIDTDLPDTTEVIVSVERRYYEVGDTAAYSRRYFEGIGPISKWRTPCRVLINDKRWKADLRASQAKMARLSSELAFTIDRIEDQIVARAVVHMNQPDPRFGGPGNPNLSGAAISRRAGRNDLNLIEDQKEIELPLTGKQPAKSARNVSFSGLVKGESYRLLTETPLMAASPDSASNSDFEEAMQITGATLYIPAGRIVRVLSIDRSSGLHPWYEVEVIGSERATGWINSMALMRSGVALE